MKKSVNQMISQVNDVILRHDLQELTKHGNTHFPLAIYENDLHHTPKIGFSAHWHRELQFYYTLDNSYLEIHVGSNKYQLKPREVVFINKEKLHSAYPIGNHLAMIGSIAFGEELIGSFPGSALETEYVRPVLSHGADSVIFTQDDPNDIPLINYIMQIHDEVLRGEPHSHLKVTGKLMLCWEFVYAKMATSTAVENPRDEYELTCGKNMLTFIKENHEKPLTLKEIAKSAHLCRSDANKIFKKVVHKSPIEFLIQYRIQQACHFLRETEMTVTEIAYSVGFASTSYFIKTFKNNLGVTPLQYRAIGFL